MFSLDRFYNILHDNLISQFTNGRSVYFYPFGTYQYTNFLSDQFDIAQPEVPFKWHKRWPSDNTFVHCYFFDQEPLYDYTLPIIDKSRLNPVQFTGPNRINIFATSEKSNFATDCVKSLDYYNWYYFFHGFAALDWYRDFKYVEPHSFNRFDKVFICYNHLTSKYRSYRLHLVSNLLEQDLVKHGRVSLFHQGWQETIQDKNVPLDNRARVKIYKALKNITEPLTIDTDNPNGALSATVVHSDLTSALFHVVTETVYFQDKLHLTEKVFKPIVAKRPFFLVAAPGNLAYLKSYGFKTFDRWIDESYDLETDHYMRIEKITAELARLCAMDPNALKQMHTEMQEVLEYNFNHFYTTFKDLIIDELVDNFEHILCRINNGRMPNNHSRYHQRFDISPEYLQEVKNRLKQ
ncbi:hypothetical protein UFOVP112_324 [uncultured Caudovirales phage]|uniref:Uncharacterized protein n=1 Tax=uncultured Caudovirales phage TaxID=2100421 RepID=A0A6J5L7M6_9CAUD|nr:hypothetical protein UFOVP112_324 [uncultured Caudovirales phage]